MLRMVFKMSGIALGDLLPRDQGLSREDLEWPYTEGGGYTPPPPGEDAMGRSCILDSPPGRWMPAAVRMPAVVRMPACHSRRFKGERPIGAATGCLPACPPPTCRRPACVCLSDAVSPPNIIMLTRDVALLKDPAYLELVQDFAANPSALDNAFANAWYKLMTRDMGPRTRCTNADAPPAQDWQHPLPPAPGPPKGHGQVKRAISDVLRTSPKLRVLLAELAWQCAATFRATDYRGGCNGARVRFPPQSEWPGNQGLLPAIAVLGDVRSDTAAAPVSWADLIVLAGNTALEAAGAPSLPFCPGRADAPDGRGNADLAPHARAYADPVVELTDRAAVMGLTFREAVALQARPRSATLQRLRGYSGSWTEAPPGLSNRYFAALLGPAHEEWEALQAPGGATEYWANGTGHWLPTDMAIRWDPELRAVAQEYAADNALFLAEFARAWTKMMNADRFPGPSGSPCPSA